MPEGEGECEGVGADFPNSEPSRFRIGFREGGCGGGGVTHIQYKQMHSKKMLVHCLLFQ